MSFTRRDVSKFTIMNGKTINFVPFELAKRYENNAQKNHYQTIERLNERGGLDPFEFYCVLKGIRHQNRLSQEECEDFIIKAVENFNNEAGKKEIQKLQLQLEIQTKRVENLKKSNEFYASKERWDGKWTLYDIIHDSDIEITDYESKTFHGGKLARSCQAIDQELEKQLEGYE